jgi:hypothetical protein
MSRVGDDHSINLVNELRFAEPRLILFKHFVDSDFSVSLIEVYLCLVILHCYSDYAYFIHWYFFVFVEWCLPVQLIQFLFGNFLISKMQRYTLAMWDRPVQVKLGQQMHWTQNNKRFPWCLEMNRRSESKMAPRGVFMIHNWI